MTGNTRQTSGPRPAPVAVHDDADVIGSRCQGEILLFVLSAIGLLLAPLLLPTHHSLASAILT